LDTFAPLTGRNFGSTRLADHDARLEVALPLDTEEYAEDFKTETSKDEFRSLLARASDKWQAPDGLDRDEAYERAGLPYTRSHLLRHTMASRLLAGGSSLKEVADVLRHRSLNTTLIYAKLDNRNLREVALPWPGSAA